MIFAPFDLIWYFVRCRGENWWFFICTHGKKIQFDFLRILTVMRCRKLWNLNKCKARLVWGLCLVYHLHFSISWVVQYLPCRLFRTIHGKRVVLGMYRHIQSSFVVLSFISCQRNIREYNVVFFSFWISITRGKNYVARYGFKKDENLIVGKVNLSMKVGMILPFEIWN